MAPFPGHFHDGVLRCDFAAQMMVDARLQCSSQPPMQTLLYPMIDLADFANQRKPQNEKFL